MEIVSKKRELKKHVSTIQCSNTLTLLQRKISNALLYNAYHELLTKEEHEISINQLNTLIGYNSNDYKTVKNALKQLISTVIEWNILDEISNEQDWNASAILASARIKGSLCTYSYSPRMKALLFSPLVYGRINLVVQSKFKSNYGLALYENCARYKGIPQTRWFEIDSFRKLMGIEADTYPKFRDLKRRVVDKAVDEVNTYSDILIKPEIRRVGKRAVAIRFYVKEREKKEWLGNPKLTIGDNHQDTVAEDLRKILCNDFGLMLKDAKKIITSYEVDYIKEKINFVTTSNSYVSGKIQNLAGYFLKALESDYQKRSVEDRAELKRKEREGRLQAEKAVKSEEEKRKRRYFEYRNNYINKKIVALSPENQSEISHKFEEYLQKPENKMFTSKHKEDGLSDKVVSAFYYNFLLGHYSALFEEILDYEAFTMKPIIDSQPNSS